MGLSNTHVSAANAYFLYFPAFTHSVINNIIPNSKNNSLYRIT